MTSDARTEDQLIDEALRALEEGLPAGEAAPADAASETLVRLYTEVLGLVPYADPPVAPSPVLRERVLAQVRGEETQVVTPAAAPPPAPQAAAALPSPIPAPTFGGPLEPQSRSYVRRPYPRSRPRRWPLALAASLVAVLAGVSGWLYMGLVQQGEKIDRLTAELGQERQRVAELEQAGGDTALVTSTAAVVMPLQPAGEPPLQPGARGVLLVADDHRHWYLSVQGLPPAAPGRDYQLWFIAGGKPISAGTFEVPAGAVPVALSAPEMPPGTEIAAITVEPDGGVPQPTGPMVLKTAEPLKIL